jgi:uncharacterized RDD family membrane protein YckC
MFTIIGSDGKEYGPVTADQIRAWIAGGRANLDTQAKPVGATDWKRVGDLPEFAAGAGGPPPLTPSTFASPAGPAIDSNLAERGTRLGAFLIDWVLQMISVLPGWLILGSTFLTIMLSAARGQEPDFSQLDIGTLVLGGSVLLLGFLSLLVVQVWMITTRGQSIGKRLLGIKIVKFADGSPAGFVHGWLLRNFVNGIIGVLPWIGILYKLVDNCFIFTDARRGIRDHIAGTKVVKV